MSSTKIGSLEIEMSANIARLTSDFAAAKDHAERATQDISHSVNAMRDKISESVKQAGEHMESFTKSIQGVQNAFQLVAEAATAGFIGEKILDLGKDFAETGEQINRTAQMTGMSTNQVQELGYAATATGASTEAMSTGMRKLSTMMIEAKNGSTAAVAAFKNVGISQEEVKSSSPHDILLKIADAYHNAEDGANKTANSQLLFGRAGMELIPTLNMGSEGLDAMASKARDLGIVLDKDTLEKGEKANEQFKEMHAVLGAVSSRIGSEMLRGMTEISCSFTDASKNGGLFFGAGEEIATLMKELAVAAAMTGETFAEWGTEIGGYGAAAVEALHGDFKGAHLILEMMDKDVDALRAKTLALVADMDKPRDAPKAQSEDGSPKTGEVGSSNGTHAKQAKSMVSEWSAAFDEWCDKQQNYFKDYAADEEKYWQQKLALVTKGSKDWESIQSKLYSLNKQQAHTKLNDDLAAIKSQSEAARQGGEERITLAMQAAQRIGEAYGTESKEYQQAMREVMKAAQEHEKEIEKLAIQRIDTTRQHDLSLVALEQNRLASERQLGTISDADELKRLIQLEERKYQIELKAAQDQAALTDAGSSEQAKIYADIEKLTEQHTMAVQKLNEQAALNTQKQWQTPMSGESSAFDTSIKRMIMATTTMQKAMANMGQSIVSEFVNMGVKDVSTWIANEMAKTTATQAGVTARLAAQSAGDKEGLASSALTVIKAILNDGAKAFSGVWAALSGIPYVGPAMAAVAAPAAMATVAGVAGSVASSAGGDWQIPADRLNFVHKNETILPADKSAGLDNLIKSGGGGDTHVHIHATDADSVKRMFAQNGSAIMDAIKHQIRGGALTGVL